MDVDEGTEQRVSVSTVTVHEGYVPETGDSDVALLRLSQSVTLSRHTIPVCLPTKDSQTGAADGPLPHCVWLGQEDHRGQRGAWRCEHSRRLPSPP